MISFDRYNLAVMVEVGFIFMGMQRLKEAKQVFEGVRALAPDIDIPVVALGNVEFCQGQLQKAVRYYREALKIDGTSLYARVYLGEALLFEGKQEEAVNMLNEVRKEDPRGVAGGFALALLDAIKEGFKPAMVKGKKNTTTKKGTDAKTKKKKTRH